MDIDKLSIYLTERNSYNNISRELVDVDADPCARSLYDFFRSHFNKKIISGQTDSYYNYIKELTGKAPLLRSWDFKHFTAGYLYHWENRKYAFGWEDDDSVQEAINWYDSTDRQGIVCYLWDLPKTPHPQQFRSCSRKTPSGYIQIQLRMRSMFKEPLLPT